jgi:hypothetical protein
MAEVEADAMMDLCSSPEELLDPLIGVALRAGAWAELVAGREASVEFYGERCPLGVFVAVVTLWGASGFPVDMVFQGFALVPSEEEK